MSYNSYAQDWHLRQQQKQNNLAHRFLEKPAMQSLLLDTQRESEVVLLGCGSGEEIGIFEEINFPIKTLSGIDKSFELIKYAKATYPHYNFQAQALEEWLPIQGYDLIYSSLTFHYVADWDSLFTKLYRALKQEGELIFSIHHPIKWGSATSRNRQRNRFLLGYEKQKNTSEFTVWGDYLTSREINDTLFGKIPITHYHRPIPEMVTIFLRTGFKITAMLEPLPSPESEKTYPDFYQTYSKIPLFLIFKLQKK